MAGRLLLRAAWGDAAHYGRNGERQCQQSQHEKLLENE
jgi:hypothetical protein